MFGNKIKLKPLSLICRSLSTMLESGVGIQKAFDLASRKTSDVRARDGLTQVRDAVKLGSDVSSAMRKQGKRFPELMLDMIEVAEKTGTMPEVLRSLAEHYENNLRLKKDFINQITWPLVQLVAAILIIAFLIFVLGIISGTVGSEPMDVLGLGLTGTSGAVAWLTMTFGTAAMLIVVYKIIVSNISGRQFLDPILMGIPVVGTCLQSFAIARFSWGFALTQQAGMAIEPSLRASLKATSNGAFISHTSRIWQRLRSGDDLSDALQPTGLFPDDYIHIVHVAETSGTVPEALDRLSPQFEKQARTSMSRLVSVAAWLIWAMVAGFIIYVIFSVAMLYINTINDALQGI